MEDCQQGFLPEGKTGKRLMIRWTTMAYWATLALLLACTSQETEPIPQDAQKVLELSFQFHDPQDQWASWAGEYLSIEPRPQTPGRRTDVKLRADGSFFDMKRGYGKDTLRWVIKDGEYTTFVNGEIVQDSAVIQKYRLSQARADGYRNYYKTKLGLPLSLKGRYQLEQGPIAPIRWRGQEVYLLEVEIADAPFASKWELFVDSKDYRLLGYAFVPEEGEGEYLVIGEYMQINQMYLPRVRHWYSGEKDEYLGTDLILTASALHE